MASEARRCPWARTGRLERAYHDTEWGVPVHSDRILFEFIILEGAQAGLSWSTILKKRDHYRRAYEHFEVKKIAAYDDRDVQRLLADPGIVRNTLKIQSSIRNARAYLQIQRECGSFDAYVWSFVAGVPQQNTWTSMKEIPVSTSESDALSRDLKARGFAFVGTTICYAFMQAVGMVNDHLRDCVRYPVVASAEHRTPGFSAASRRAGGRA